MDHSDFIVIIFLESAILPIFFSLVENVIALTLCDILIAVTLPVKLFNCNLCNFALYFQV
jgi:hypothetical protein